MLSECGRDGQANRGGARHRFFKPVNAQGTTMTNLDVVKQ